MIAVLLPDGGTVQVDADVASVVTEGGTLILRRGNTVVARFRRFTGWHEVPTPAEK